MKILFYNHTGKVSGAEKMLLMTLEKMDRSHFEPIVMCPEEASLSREVQKLGVRTENIPTLDARFTIRVDLLIKYLWSFIQVIRCLRLSVSRTNPDLLHANSIRAGLVASAATFKLGTRVVWHLHDLLPRHPISTAIRLFAFAFAKARMIAVSQAVADNFAGKFFSLRNRTVVILNGIDVERFSPTPETRERTRRELNLDESEFVIGTVGLLTPRKGQLELINSFAQVLDRVPNAKLLVVGSPVFNKDQQYADLLKRTARELGVDGRVSFVGPRDDMPAVMQSFDLLVANSSVEPFGLVIVEAMAAGVPVLASMSGGIPEVVQCGRSGWLIEFGNRQMLSEAIVKLAQSTVIRQKLAEEGRRRATTFTSERYMTELQSFYENSYELAARLSDQVHQQTAAKIA